MRHRLTPWLAAAVVLCAALAARYLLIQPPEIAHRCDGAAAPLWCLVRAAVIQTYARYELGYASLALAVLCLAMRRVAVAGATLAVGAAALVLYCYEPGALAIVVGGLRLARLQHDRIVRIDRIDRGPGPHLA